MHHIKHLQHQGLFFFPYTLIKFKPSSLLQFFELKNEFLISLSITVEHPVNNFSLYLLSDALLVLFLVFIFISELFILDL